MLVGMVTKTRNILSSPPTFQNVSTPMVWMTIVEWVECMGVVSGCGEQEAGVASGSG